MTPMSPHADDVLRAIRELDAEALQPSPNLEPGLITERLHLPSNDDQTESALVELAEAGAIEVIMGELGESHGPVVIRLSH